MTMPEIPDAIPSIEYNGRDFLESLRRCSGSAAESTDRMVNAYCRYSVSAGVERRHSAPSNLVQALLVEKFLEEVYYCRCDRRLFIHDRNRTTQKRRYIFGI